MLLERVVLQTQYAGGLVETMFARQTHGFLPELLREWGKFVALSALPAIKLATGCEQ